MKTVGMVLIAAGIIMMLFTGFNFVTREKVVDIGDLEIKANKTHHIEWTPIAGGVLLVTGMAVLFIRKK